MGRPCRLSVDNLRAGNRAGMAGDQLMGIDPGILAEVGGAFLSSLILSGIRPNNQRRTAFVIRRVSGGKGISPQSATVSGDVLG